MDRIGVIVICYGMGVLVGNSGVLPAIVKPLQESMLDVVVPLSLPLIFFQMRIQNLRNLAKVGVISLLAGLVAVTVGVTLGFFLFKDLIGEESWKVAGMLIGVYTGGTPNLAAIGQALQISQSNYIAVHTADVLTGAVLLLFFMTLAKPLFRRFLPIYIGGNQKSLEARENFSTYFSGFQRQHLWPLLGAWALAVLIVAIGGGLSYLFPKDLQNAVAILSITTLSVLLPANTNIYKIKFTYQSGFYLLTVFSFVISTLADLSAIFSAALPMLSFVALVIVITLVLHIFLCRLGGVDVDTAIITSVSFFYSPPFVPMVAASIRNQDVVLAGMITGVLGWIFGNYLGLAVAYTLRSIS